MDDEHQHRLEHAFIDGFRAAQDKQAFLHLSGIPYELDADGAPSLKLIEIRVEETFEVGSVTRGFASPELVHHALPAEMIGRHTRLSFAYVSTHERRELRFAEIVAMGQTP